MKKELSYMETLSIISEIKQIFEKQLEKRLDLIKVPSPLFVKRDSGLQDGLSGTEKAVFFVKGDEYFEIVHSLAKWKRDALGRYQFPMHKGILTDMKAIRKEEVVDDIHSVFVEQWDWEKVISKEDRTISFLEETVQSIYKAMRETLKCVKQKHHFIDAMLPKKVTFITSQELEDMYPSLTPSEREQVFTKEKKAVFIIGIGDKLKSGSPHDKRSPDYDDWSLDGDLLFYDKAIGKAMEMTSMGIRVSEDSLVAQLKKAGVLERKPYHQMILEKKLPYTIGGGIGQSRLAMFILSKTHIAEVQASTWEDITLSFLKEKMIL